MAEQYTEVQCSLDILDALVKMDFQQDWHELPRDKLHEKIMHQFSLVIPAFALYIQARSDARKAMDAIPTPPQN
jgi:hypothetical protein